MDRLIELGKRRTVLLTISILLVSLNSIYLYHAARPEIEYTKLIQQTVRFLLTLGLLYMVYKGKKWAKTVAIVLFAIAILGLLLGVSTIETSLLNKSPFIVAIFIYGLAIYHFGFAESFRAFSQYQNNKSSF